MAGGRGFGSLLIGTGQYLVVTAGGHGFPSVLVVAADGLADGILSAGLGVDGWRGINAQNSFWLNSAHAVGGVGLGLTACKAYVPLWRQLTGRNLRSAGAATPAFLASSGLAVVGQHDPSEFRQVDLIHDVRTPRPCCAADPRLPRVAGRNEQAQHASSRSRHDPVELRQLLCRHRGVVRPSERRDHPAQGEGTEAGLFGQLQNRVRRVLQADRGVRS